MSWCVSHHITLISSGPALQYIAEHSEFWGRCTSSSHWPHHCWRNVLSPTMERFVEKCWILGLVVSNPQPEGLLRPRIAQHRQQIYLKYYILLSLLVFVMLSLFQKEATYPLLCLPRTGHYYIIFCLCIFAYFGHFIKLCYCSVWSIVTSVFHLACVRGASTV